MASMNQALGALAAVAAGVHQSHYSYQGLGALGRNPPRRGRRGGGSKTANLKNLPLALQDAAKSDAKALRERIKMANAQAWAEFMSKYPGAIPVEQRKIDRVVARFLLGQPESDSSAYVKSEMNSRGELVLRVQGREVATRDNSASRFVKVCPGEFGTGKADRSTANSVLRQLQAGLRATDREGTVFLAPSGNQGRVVSPDACMLVEVNARVRKAAMTGQTSRYNPRGGGTFVSPGAGSSADYFAAEARMQGRNYQSTQYSAPPGFRYPGT